MRKPAKLLLLATIMLLVTMMMFAQTTNLTRNETVYCSGGMWSPPSNWNPFQYTGLDSSGTVGLLYEPLLYFNPVTGEFPACLATSAKWTDKTTFEVKVRQGVKWSDGVAFTADDVVFTFEVAKYFKNISWSTLWDGGGLTEVKKIDEATVNFIFSAPRYQNWVTQLYQIPMVPKHIFDGKSENELTTDSGAKSVGTGPYLHVQALADRDIYTRNDNWWGKDSKEFGKLPAAKNLVLLMVNDNSTALGMLLKGDIDIDNNYTPGMPALIESYGVKTYYKAEPYHLSWNTTMLYLNNKKAPLNDPKFRKALAFAIDTKTIAKVDYQNGVLPAASHGFLPIKTLTDYIDSKALSPLYFSYNVATANKLLDAAGYVKGKDGFRTGKDKKAFSLEINCPVGWSDWEIGIRLVAKNLQSVGVNAIAKPVDFSVWQTNRFNCTFDMLLDNNTTLSPSPNAYISAIATQDFAATNNTRGNWGQYTNAALGKLITDFDMTNPATDMKTSISIITKIETMLLNDMPAIPLWYNGLWFCGGSTTWKGYSDETNKLGVTCMWANTWQLGGVQSLVNMTLK